MTDESRAIGATFYARPAEEVAPELLGLVIVSTIGGERTVGRIVETEAYIGPEDAASHAAERIGRTRRNESMFGPPGIAYVYRIYGIHWCLNVVTGRAGHPAAVLIRAVEPLDGTEVMQARRGVRHTDRRLTGGPARVTQAMAITGAHDGHPLDREPLRLVRPARRGRAEAVASGPRIGVTRAIDWPLRFFYRGNRCVSR